MAFISRKLDGLALWPTFCTTRAAMGTADTPAAPIIGFTFPRVITYISLPSSVPAAVPTTKAARPRPMIMMVLIVRNSSADILEPTATPRKIVTMLISSFWAVLDRRSTTPASRKRFPSISMPINGLAAGTSSAEAMVVRTGKRIFTRRLTGLTSLITTIRSFFVVRARITGGWMIGTRAI